MSIEKELWFRSSTKEWVAFARVETCDHSIRINYPSKYKFIAIAKRKLFFRLDVISEILFGC